MSKLERIYDDDEIDLVSTKGYEKFNNEFVRYTKQKLKFYKELFEVDSLRKLRYVIFDDLEEYRNLRRKQSGHEPPQYSRGCFCDDTVMMVIEDEPKEGSEEFFARRGSGAHEAFHTYYREYVYKSDENRVVWFDEGMAQLFSGQKDHMTDKMLEEYYLKFKTKYKKIDNLNERVQGNSNVPDDKIFTRKGVIDGYKISYLALRYLYDEKGLEYIKGIMGDKEKILKEGESIIPDMMKYFDEKFKSIEER